jgi:hypothetical protein
VTPTEIIAALARHGTRVAVDGDRVRLIHDLGNPPPTDLVDAAREVKAALRQIIVAPEVRPNPPAGPEYLPEPTTRWTQLVLQWGGSINEGVAVVQRVCASAGLPGTWRRGLVGHLFAKIDEYRWNGRRKIEHLKLIADRMKVDPMYFPGSRPDVIAAGRDNDEIVLRALTGGQRSKAKLERMTGLSKHAISTRLLLLKKAGKVVCVHPGVYVLPECGAARHVPACEAIIAVLWWAPSHQATANKLAAETCLTRNAIDSSANRMLNTGALVRPKRGVFALSSDTLRKIQRREPIRIGHSVFILDPASQQVALRIVRG